MYRLPHPVGSNHTRLAREGGFVRDFLCFFLFSGVAFAFGFKVKVDEGPVLALAGKEGLGSLTREAGKIG